MTPASGVSVLPPYYRDYRVLRLMPQSRRSTYSVYCVVLGRPYVNRVQGVVDRTVGACPITCSPKHLTYDLFHSYISTTHSLHPQGLCISFFCVILGRYRLRAWGSKTTRSHRLVAIRAILKPRLYTLCRVQRHNLSSIVRIYF